MSSLLEKLLKNTTIKSSSLIEDSKIYNKKDMIPTPIPMINVALSGSIDGGLTPGLLTIAGPSKHFKTMFALIMAASFQRKYPDGIVLFYDSEFGSPISYFKSMDLDMQRVVHTPITDVEELKHDIMKQLTEIDRNDKLLVIVDSVGNLASKKEVKDAIEGNEVADMTRAKAFKSFGRMVTPHLTLKDIPMIVINHTYQTQEKFSKTVVSGGTGMIYSSDAVWVIGRQQDKDDDGLHGYDFIINIDKSRFVKEKSKIPISVSFESGINKWSGLFDVALEGEYIISPKKGWYATVNKETGEISTNFRRGDIENSDKFWNELFQSSDILQYIKRTYSLDIDIKLINEE